MSGDSQTTMNFAGRSNTRTIVQVGMLGAVAMVLMFFEVPLWFAPPFYKMDLSELPVLIGCFAMGPAAGVMIELVKILLHLVVQGTTTAGVGDLANFLIGCSFVVPAGMIYKKIRTKKGAVIGMIVGTVTMTVLGCVLNAFVLLPFYATAFEMPMDVLIQMGTAVNAWIQDVFSFVILAVAPFNILKGMIVSALTFLLYKHIRPILRRQ
ncbi:MAG: ECF transporter S component [Lachnospiraceae bacterium]|nr:ECF transporter S component [Robinsoniella sp.]MDY3767858.1 ECF transporter S component [Lachnospiraceae bacterium]